MASESLVRFVTRSEVRCTLLLALAAGPETGPALVADLSVSKSGVYKALGELSDRRLVSRPEDGGSRGGDWRLTDPGRLVVDLLERQERLERLLADREYWLRHDVSELPDRFRRRLPALGDANLRRNPPNEPRYLEQEWVERISDADRLWVGNRVVHEPYAEATNEQVGPDAETRIVHHGPVLERFRERYSISPAEFANGRPDAVEERVCDIPCSFMLTDDLFTLSLPLHDGEYDPDTVLVGRDEAALRFGEDLFAFYWEQATPVEAYLHG